jgi:hypothetical protein
MITAPATHPWDVPAIVADALDVLRLLTDDPDADRIEQAAPVATAMADAMLDADVAFVTIPDPVHYGAVLLTVELYRRKDAPFGVLNAWSVDDIALRVGSDVMRSVRSLFIPYKVRFGVA